MIVGLSGQAGSGKDTVADFLVEHHGFVKIALADPIKRAAMEWWDFTEEQLWGPSSERNKPDKRYPLRVRKDGVSIMDIEDANFLIHCHTAAGEKLTEEDKEAIRLDVRTDYLTPRHALQQIGTEVARAIDPDVWVRLTMRIAKQLLTTPGAFYIRTGGVLVEVINPGDMVEFFKGVVISDCRFKNEFKQVKDNGILVRIKRPTSGLEGQQAQHQSEAEQREFPDGYFDHVIDNDGDTLHNLKLRVDSMMDFIAGRMKKYDANGDDDVPPFKRD